MIDAFPWHEIYRADNGGSWKTLYQFTPANGAASVINLAPVFENAQIRISK
ncbi:Fibronectin type 3 domains containing extracellular protein [Neobacillus vireti LMG 21834]|uniref:Fibronectin type 3 domains containing extracellular protein n=1 Tax=Neobacillus vireti LMG 21834 TaxID=1131730 RepID=A0AB94IKW6_9BACI|nr:Fibronectin type 3 domains containing extracellular protein [Neobacillus vireti LMG 21834]